MSGRTPFPPGCANDTSPEARAKQIELLRRMPPGERFRNALELTAFVQRLQEAGQWRLHPNASRREIFLRAAVLRLGAETVRKVYGWAPGAPVEP